MPSSFDKAGLFNSGPHRFRRLPSGVQTIPAVALDGVSPGTIPLGPLELIIEVRGRLVAPTDAALDALLAAIHAKLTFPALAADLIDHHGRIYENMSFVRFESADRIDRARQVTLPYTARFIRFLNT